MNNEVEKNLPLVSYVLNKYFHRWDEDMFQVGCIGLIKGVKTYDKSKNTNKSTYYSKCIRNEIGGYMRLGNTRKRGKDFTTVSLSEPITNENLYLEDIMESDDNVEDVIYKNEELMWLEEHIKLLNEKEQYVLTHYYGLFKNKPKTQCEIAIELNTTQVCVCRTITKSINKLKGMKESEDEII